MRALFAKGVAQSSVLRKLDARTKLIVTATTAVLTVASSGMVSQLVLFAVTLVYVLLLKRPGLVAVLYVLMAAMMETLAASEEAASAVTLVALVISVVLMTEVLSNTVYRIC